MDSYLERCSPDTSLPHEEPCERCGEPYPPSLCEDYNHVVCYACRFVQNVVEWLNSNCGQLRLNSNRLWVIPDAAERFEKLGWTVKLLAPSGKDVDRGEFTLRLKAADVTHCSGLPRATACSGVSTSEAVRAFRQRYCQTNCSVAALETQTSIDALTKRCCATLPYIKSEPMEIERLPAELPGMIGAVRNLKAGGWTALVKGARYTARYHHHLSASNCINNGFRCVS